ncbi:MAG: NADH-quinone oxidoreductase subunit J [Chitinophagaceae bacterium]|nr:MAG: NADH-quinone oxidoreductase subunit J [Chitinophagaceae bacterium]
MNVIFYIASIIAILATIMVITGRNAIHSLLFLIVSLLAIGVVFFTLGAPFMAALEVIIYAGAIMVLFVFVIMMLNLGKAYEKMEESWFSYKAWLGPGILCIILLGELIYVFTVTKGSGRQLTVISPQEVGMTLFGPYILGVELAAMLLMTGIIGAYHIGRRKQKEYHRLLQKEEEPA